MYNSYLEKFISFVVFSWIQTLPIIEHIFVCLLVINIIDKRISIWSPTNEQQTPKFIPNYQSCKHIEINFKEGQNFLMPFSLIIPKWGRKQCWLISLVKKKLKIKKIFHMYITIPYWIQIVYVHITITSI